jgi:ribosomal protein S18 acetylase RimI-like enzyme
MSPWLLLLLLLLLQEGQAQRRAYLSNICVAQGARRQGIAAALMAEAERVAAGLGEAWLVQCIAT